MAEKKAPRNKTITTSVEEGRLFLERCIRIEQPVTDINTVLDKTVIGDSIEVMSRLPEAFADLVIVDPPYNLYKDFNGSRFSKTDPGEYEEYTRNWLSSVKPLIRETGSIYVCCDWESSLIIGRVLSEMFKVRNRITWQREKGRGASANWKNGMEDIWFATVSDHYTFNLDDVKVRRKVIAPYKSDGKPKDWNETDAGRFRDTCPSNFWDDISIPFWSMPENTAHPTQKPEKLLAKLILASSNKGDVVFDPFAGSGSTPVTAYKLGRHYLAVEINEQYCVWGEQRLEMARDNKTIQGYADGVFWERNTFAVQKNGGQ